jgi:hypothetical protein
MKKKKNTTTKKGTSYMKANSSRDMQIAKKTGRPVGQRRRDGVALRDSGPVDVLEERILLQFVPVAVRAQSRRRMPLQQLHAKSRAEDRIRER